MAGRIRTLKPELLEDERVAGLSSHAFRLFVGCILLADDHGNLRLRVGLLAGAIFWRLLEENQLVIGDIEDALREITSPDGGRPGLLTPYRVRGQIYAHVSGWEKHQKVDHPGAPRMPLSTDAEAERFSFDSDGIRDSRETLSTVSGGSRESLAPDLRSPTPISDPDPDQKIPAPAGSEPDGSGCFPRSEEGPPSPAKPTPPDPQAPAPEARSADPTPASVAPRAPASSAGPKATPAATMDLPLGPMKRTPVDEVYETYLEGWRTSIGGTRPPVLTDKRRKLIREQLKYFQLDDLKLACRGVWLVEFNVQGGHYGIDLVLRDAEHIERFRDVAARGKPVVNGSASATPRRPAARVQTAPEGSAYTNPDFIRDPSRLPPVKRDANGEIEI